MKRLCVGLLVISSAVHAETYHVSQTKGDDANPGTKERPLKTFWAGVEKLKDNDTLYVAPGVYWHRNHEADGARKIANVGNCRIVAEPRGGAVITCAWKEALEGTVSWKHERNGYYSATAPPHLRTTAHVLLDGKTYYLPKLEEEWLRNPDDIDFGRLRTRERGIKMTLPPYGFAVNESAHRVTLRLPGNADPNGRSIVFQSSRVGTRWQAHAMELHNTRNLVIDGLVVQGASTGIKALPGNHGLVVRNCRFEHTQTGVDIEESDDTLVEWCEYTFPGLEAWVQKVLDDNHPVYNRFPYHFGKSPCFHNEGGLVGVKKLRNHTCRFNYSHGAMDGYSWGSCDQSEFHHNVVCFMLDNGWENDDLQEGWGKDMRIHHNLVLDVKTVPVSQQHQGPGKTNVGKHWEGPIYVYRNVVIGYGNAGWDGGWIKGVSQVWEKGYNVYHNTVWKHSTHVMKLVSEQTTQEAMNSVRLTNNLIIMEDEIRSWWLRDRPENATFNNVVVTKNLEEGATTLLANGGIRLRSMQEVLLTNGDMGISPGDQNLDNDELDFSLTAASPCVDAGRRLPVSWPESGRAYAGAAPDVGAIEFSEKVDSYGIPYDKDWPRPRRTVYRDTYAPPRAAH